MPEFDVVMVVRVVRVGVRGLGLLVSNAQARVRVGLRCRVVPAQAPGITHKRNRNKGKTGKKSNSNPIKGREFVR
jgi:hypothetical protein